ncbi:MAG: VOC family protein [Candidatus Limnocylindrales bacterium]
MTDGRSPERTEPPLEQLDFVYLPSADVAADLRYFTEVLGARPVFAVEGMGTRVAMVELTAGPPRLLLAGHLEGERPILIYRVADLDRAMGQLEARGWQRQGTLEIPQGPCCSFEAPGGQRLAIYQRARPEVEGHFEGRRDF